MKKLNNPTLTGLERLKFIHSGLVRGILYEGESDEGEFYLHFVACPTVTPLEESDKSTHGAPISEEALDTNFLPDNCAIPTEKPCHLVMVSNRWSTRKADMDTMENIIAATKPLLFMNDNNFGGKKNGRWSF
eukprot:CAMPEP_0178933126 /NCGR_PEP_ID=MMETSP0786-20121207/23075_1 /TAXON_ID=186022 /ORGANISM="Thalassionema frauenfeldii, Strain CCMP 1798" /LENGTH=131 /DNA_ID=CAMNT_0020610645 /DNA_START=132 /DNA_END=527 /DNA_ORIENTATION=-